ncbi:hypothetical protein [Vallitalea okinawensis]|uniref:hypothetical protein n=1 Tax=Vallitalea okinawensis TaxID=2078660 RepID=UPI000CFC0427|nr:hypothetical protein [Vallitalea okinawensis]
MDSTLLAGIIIFNLLYSFLQIKRAHESNYTNWVKFTGDSSTKKDKLLSFLSVVMIVLISEIKIRIYALGFLFFITIAGISYINIQCYKRLKEIKIIRHTIYNVILCTVLMILVYFITYPK